MLLLRAQKRGYVIFTLVRSMRSSSCWCRCRLREPPPPSCLTAVAGARDAALRCDGPAASFSPRPSAAVSAGIVFCTNDRQDGSCMQDFSVDAAVAGTPTTPPCSAGHDSSCHFNRKGVLAASHQPTPTVKLRQDGRMRRYVGLQHAAQHQGGCRLVAVRI